MYTDKIIEFSRYTLPIMLGLAFALQLWIFIFCTRYKKNALNMNNTNKELFRSIKLRYTNSTKLNIPLLDTNSFVEKYFYGKGGPFRLACNIDRFSGFLLCSALMTTIALYVRDYSSNARVTAFIGIAVCFYIFRAILSTEKQMHLAITYTTDYLENTLKHRINPEPLRSTRTLVETSKKNQAECNNTTATSKTTNNIANPHTSTPADTDIIEAVLQEFLA